MENNTQSTTLEQDAISMRVANYRKSSFDYQMRRHGDWRENYALYRDKVQVNRLTQRQSVNVPLMKESIRTLLAKTDEFPDVYFESLSGDKQKEIFINEYWKWWVNEDKFEVKDIVDKKQVGLYGRSVMKLNLFDGRPSSEVLEPYDWLVDRQADPSDLDGTAMYQAHINIFRTISQLEANPLYSKDKINKLRSTYASSMGLARSEENIRALMAKNQRMEDLGLFDTQNPSVGEKLVQVNEHYLKIFDEKSGRLVIHLIVTADAEELIRKPLEDILGINFFPFISWADDIEKTDAWSDGMGDIVRTPNKVVNSWLAQLVENRTMRNFGMNYYDATVDEKFTPQMYTPEPWGWYPVAGDPNKVVKRVDIPELSESLDEMNFIIGMVERATAATASQKGEQVKGDVTLGEVKLMMANANERITSIAKFYRIARREFGEKWYKFMFANAEHIKAVELYKKSSGDNYFKETVTPDDWKDDAGYACKVITTAERTAKGIEEVQKLQAVSGMFPENQPLKKILMKRSLDLLDGLSTEEIKEVMDAQAMPPMPPVDPSTGLPSPVDMALEQQSAMMAK